MRGLSTYALSGIVLLVGSPSAASALQVAEIERSDRDVAQSAVIERLADFAAREQALGRDLQAMDETLKNIKAELQSRKSDVDTLQESTAHTIDDFRAETRWYFTVVVLAWASLVAAILGIGYDISRRLHAIEQRIFGSRRSEMQSMSAVSDRDAGSIANGERAGLRKTAS
jgi:hypothetical protein